MAFTPEDKSKMDKIANAMQELINGFASEGKMFVYTMAVRESHKLGNESIMTLSGFTNTYKDNLYESMAFMHRDLIDKASKSNNK